ncbi:hypothetical protein ELH27_21660 [Rhizobium leguminosarum]|uniref:Uncharacterized protein n=1 Tax=Rhizobium beringeri TaxID=3019934 RepID=A0ABY1Y0Z5_9HYPH|nr:hypothetical protein EHI45_25060 [Rhizobium leguminosarum]TBC75312.1 hypothetical protein ELH27_21660 [Rhizobium leguminosarum]TBD07001.1 hypothetical protein ELH21_22515 [Rhizobium leguminosarum]TBE73190.1 hypothetical protein ELH03_21670 [Rhizobium beringeri]
MSRKSVQRFCDNDMRRNKKLKRKERIWKIATCFSAVIFPASPAWQAQHRRSLGVQTVFMRAA